MFQTPAVPAPPPAPRTSFLGVGAGLFIPFDRDVRDAFDGRLLNIGPAFLGGRPREGRVRPTFSFLTARRNGNTLFAVPLTLSFETQFRQTGRSAVPFLRLDGGVAYIDYALTVDGNRLSGKVFRPTAGLEFGYLINRRLQLSAGVQGFGSAEGLDFSGVSFRLAYGLLPIRRR